MKKSILNLIFSFFLISTSFSQVLVNDFDLIKSQMISSNSVGDIIFQKNCLWISGGKGVSKSTDMGYSWTSLLNVPEFKYPDIVSFEMFGDTIWCSMVYSKENATAGSVSTGGGFTFSTDAGRSWKYREQVLDSVSDTVLNYGNNKINALPIVVPEQNITYSISLTKKTVWINSWSSGLRKSTDMGKTFQRIILPPDTLNSISPNDTLNFKIDPRKNNNHLGFSVLAVDENEIWAGTAKGVNKSTDGGISWKRFSHQNQDSAILGNWVISIKRQNYKNIDRIFLCTWKTDDQTEENGVSYTENGGKSWKSILQGEKINSISFRDSVVYFSGAKGIFRSDDNLNSFTFYDNIIAHENNYKILIPSIYSIEPQNDTIWIGTSDGLVYTIDNKFTKFGSKWKIFRTFQKSSVINKSYAYPNPFPPDDGYTRIHYQIPQSGSNVSIDIFDFGMNLVRRLISNVSRTGNIEQEEIWNGKGDNNNFVGNGVYFFRVKTESEVSWGKIIVLR